MKNKINKELAPIIIFTYKRIFFLKKLIRSLENARYFKNSRLIIFSDGPIDQSDYNQVMLVRNYLKKYKMQNVNVEIFIRNKNYGLKRNIIEGLNYVSKRFEKFIVLEEDLEVRNDFLTVMNKCLEIYEFDKSIYHINAWTSSLQQKYYSDNLNLSNIMSCWGWATWSDRWKKNHFNLKKIIRENRCDSFKSITLNYKNTLLYQTALNYFKIKKTWALYWYALIHSNSKFCINFKHSLVINNGFDGSGHSKDLNDILNSKLDTKKIFFDKKINKNKKIIYRNNLLAQNYYLAVNFKKTQIIIFRWVISNLFLIFIHLKFK